MRILELTRAGMIGTVAIFVVVAVCVRLGLWQLDRRDQRLERNAVMAERMAADPLLLRSPPADTTGLTYRRAVIEGTMESGRSVVLAGRSRNGLPGVHVLTPVVVDGGAVLVNRGWLPAPDAATVELEALGVGGPVRVEGVLLPFPAVDLELADSAFRTTWFRFDGDALRAQYPYPVAPLYLRATDDPTRPGGSSVPEAAATPIALDRPTLDAGPHLSYAIQWFSFAAVFLGGWVALLLRRGRPAGEPVDRA
jgi:surfeit locus 1 family protein